MSALDKQEGGDHYKKLGQYQPWEVLSKWLTPDELRGQVIKASIVLTAGTEGTEELKTEIQEYVKTHTAPYKYPRIVEFRESLPKTTSGKIIRRLL